MGEGIIPNNDKRRMKLRAKFHDVTGVSATLILRPGEIKNNHRTFVGRYTLLLEHSAIVNGEKIEDQKKKIEELEKKIIDIKKMLKIDKKSNK